MNNRGGVEVARLWEWGGENTEGEDEFAKQRPGWEMPIHDLLVKHGVSIVFHGHDHLFIKQDLDGIVYQEVPQPVASSFREHEHCQRVWLSKWRDSRAVPVTFACELDRRNASRLCQKLFARSRIAVQKETATSATRT